MSSSLTLIFKRNIKGVGASGDLQVQLSVFTNTEPLVQPSDTCMSPETVPRLDTKAQGQSGTRLPAGAQLALGNGVLLFYILLLLCVCMCDVYM